MSGAAAAGVGTGISKGLDARENQDPETGQDQEPETLL
jgi:hypothetical protein